MKSFEKHLAEISFFFFLTASCKHGCFCLTGKETETPKGDEPNPGWGSCGRAQIGKGGRNAQLMNSQHLVNSPSIYKLCYLPCPGTAGTALFQTLKIPVQIPALPDTNV